MSESNLIPALQSHLRALESDPWDAATWEKVLAQAARLPVATARPLYENFLKLFPHSARHWVEYISHELRTGDDAVAEAALSRCLFLSFDPLLWEKYTSFVVSVKLRPAERAYAAVSSAAQSRAPALAALLSARQEALQALEFALQNVGHAFQAEPLWQALLVFLKSAPEATTHEVAVNRDALRKGYHRALAVPHKSIESTWTEYAEFEKAAAQPALAAVLIAAQQGPYATAKAVLRERTALWRGIDTSLLAVPPPPGSSDTGSQGTFPPLSASHRSRAATAEAIAEQAILWRRVLEYELSNPLRLPPDSHTQVVRLHFRQFLAVCRWHPDAWYDAAMYEAGLASGGSAAAAASVVLRCALDAMPSSALLAFAAADFLEGVASDADGAKAVYTSLVSTLESVAAGAAPGAKSAASGSEIGGRESSAPVAAVTPAARPTEGLSAVASDSGSSAAAAAVDSVPSAALDDAAPAVNAPAAVSSEDAPAIPAATAPAPGDAGVPAGDAVAPPSATVATVAPGDATPAPTEKKQLAAHSMFAAYPTLARLDLMPAVAGVDMSGNAHVGASICDFPGPQDAAAAQRVLPLVFVTQQRFARRGAGGIDAARAVFAAARKSPWTTPGVFVASALLELHVNRDLNVARNVLTAARKRFPADLSLALTSADILTAHDDVPSVRAFFESVLASPALAPADSRPLWDRFIAFELLRASGGGGDAGGLSVVAALEQRRAEQHPHLAGPSVRALSQLLHRYLGESAGVAAAALGGGPAGECGGLLPSCDADLLRRHPYAPFATLPALAAAGAPEAALQPPSYATPSDWARAGGAAAAQGLRDGLYLQKPLEVSSVLSHVPHMFLEPVQLNASSDRTLHVAPHASVGSVGTDAKSASGIDNTAATLVIPDVISGLLARLPAKDPTLALRPTESADAILSKVEVLIAGSAAGGAKEGGVHAAGQKRSHDSDAAPLASAGPLKRLRAEVAGLDASASAAPTFARPPVSGFGQVGGARGLPRPAFGGGTNALPPQWGGAAVRAPLPPQAVVAPMQSHGPIGYAMAGPGRVGPGAQADAFRVRQQQGQQW